MMEDICYIEPKEIPLSEFPADPDLPEGVRCIKLDDDPGLQCRYVNDVVYAERSGEKQHLQILIPESRADGFPPKIARRWPLVVYIPGSAFHRQYIHGRLGPMFDFCRRGYVVAVVEYRPSEVAPFPAQMQDAKTAVRFMRKHAEEYCVDTEKLAIWGDSSGAHTAVICGVTGDADPDTPDYGEYSAQVGCIIDWFGPTDIAQMNCRPSAQDHRAPNSPEGFFIGQRPVLEHPEITQQANPAAYLTEDRPTPPILIMHGDCDRLVPFNQSVLLYNKLRATGKDVEFYKLLGSDHVGAGFLSRRSFDIVDEFIRRKLGLRV